MSPIFERVRPRSFSSPAQRLTRAPQPRTMIWLRDISGSSTTRDRASETRHEAGFAQGVRQLDVLDAARERGGRVAVLAMKRFSRMRVARTIAPLLLAGVLHGCSPAPAAVAEAEQIEDAVARAEMRLKAAQSGSAPASTRPRAEPPRVSEDM